MMGNFEINIGRSTLDDLFKTDEGRKTEEIIPVKLSELKPFTEQPFKVLDNEDMDELVASVKSNGVLSPIVARPHPEGGYEILSGHRRYRACEIAGITEVPVVVKNLDDDTAIILLVDSNLQREHILPSEKGFAYRMRLEAMKRKAGRPPKENASQVATNYNSGRSDELLGEQIGESKDQIRRYIRLTELIDPLLEMVDEKTMAFNAGVELSYLNTREQADVLDAIKSEDGAPSIEQAKKIRRFSEEGRLNPDVVLSIMQERKEESIKITIKDDKIKKYFPKGYTKKQMEETIIKLLEKWHRKMEMER